VRIYFYRGKSKGEENCLHLSYLAARKKMDGGHALFFHPRGGGGQGRRGEEFPSTLRPSLWRRKKEKKGFIMPFLRGKDEQGGREEEEASKKILSHASLYPLYEKETHNTT